LYYSQQIREGEFMDKEKFIEKIKEAGLSEDMVMVRGILAEIQDEVSKVFDESVSMKETLTKQNEDMESLRQANMDLFKKLGTNDKPDETGIKPEEVKVYESYENLAKNFM
jgi:predicted nuclease with TOPRIM domain